MYFTVVIKVGFTNFYRFRAVCDKNFSTEKYFDEFQKDLKVSYIPEILMERVFEVV